MFICVHLSFIGVFTRVVTIFTIFAVKGFHICLGGVYVDLNMIMSVSNQLEHVSSTFLRERKSYCLTGTWHYNFIPAHACRHFLYSARWRIRREMRTLPPSPYVSPHLHAHSNTACLRGSYSFCSCPRAWLHIIGYLGPIIAWIIKAPCVCAL